MTTPGAEFIVDERLVTELVRTQHPDLAHLEVTFLNEGWDNSSWRLGSELVLRLPRRAVAIPLLATEQRWLPVLAPRLPLLVPAPVRVGVASDLFAHSWSIVPWIEGTPGDEATLIEPERAASTLAEFLRALHTTAPAEAPTNPFRSIPLHERAESFQTNVATLGGEIDGALALEIFTQASQTPGFDAAPVWIHGDLHPANTIIHDGRLVGVIDFGDLCGGDPATDLAGGWMLLPSEQIGTFFDAYGASDDLIERSRGWAACFAVLFALIGRDGRPTYGRIGHATLARLAKTH